MTGRDPGPGSAGLARSTAALETDALRGLEVALRGTSLCHVDADGVLAAKHWEGRAAALAEVRRALRGTAEPDRQVVDLVRRSWTARFGGLRGEVWAAYTAGGLEALDELDDTP